MEIGLHAWNMMAWSCFEGSLASNIGVAFVILLVIEFIDFQIVHWVIERYHDVQNLDWWRKGSHCGNAWGWNGEFIHCMIFHICDDFFSFHIVKVDSIIFPTRFTICELMNFLAYNKFCSFRSHSTLGQKFEIFLDPPVAWADSSSMHNFIVREKRGRRRGDEGFSNPMRL